MYPGIDTEICNFAVVWVNFVEDSFWYQQCSELSHILKWLKSYFFLALRSKSMDFCTMTSYCAGEKGWPLPSLEASEGQECCVGRLQD
jgi:hypothetical protein